MQYSAIDMQLSKKAEMAFSNMPNEYSCIQFTVLLPVGRDSVDVLPHVSFYVH